MSWVALDVGGANIKVADGHGYAARYRFALWREPARLTERLRTALAEAPPADRIAVTMTGELADCFSSKSDGVAHIVRSVCDASDGRHVRVYLVDGRLVAPSVALLQPWLAAASNWHVLARFTGQLASEGLAMLIDIGSTTTDIIPLREGQVATNSLTDTQRLIAGELVYTGVERSPICGLVDTLPYRGNECPVMQEWFATTLDAYLLLGDIAESNSCEHTADGRPSTRAAARLRLSRMIGAPEPDFHHRDALVIAHRVAEVQLRRVRAGVERVLAGLGGTVGCFVFSGQGEFLARRAVAGLVPQARCVSLARQLGRAVSVAAPAHALAYLAEQGVMME